MELYQIIYNTINILKRTELEYRLNRADLMIMRKEVIDLVTSRLKSIKSDTHQISRITLLQESLMIQSLKEEMRNLF